jgi:hypothetical protein
MSPDALRSTALEIAGQLARGEYESVVNSCATSRLTSDDLRRAVHEYGRKLVSPPQDAYNNLDAVEVNGAATPTWSVRVPLWTEEEGRSDLTLELTISPQSAPPCVELDDLHVL